MKHRSILTTEVARFPTWTTATVQEQEDAMRDGMARADDVFAALQLISTDVIADAGELDAATIWATNAQIRNPEVKACWLHGFRTRLRMRCDELARQARIPARSPTPREAMAQLERAAADVRTNRPNRSDAS